LKLYILVTIFVSFDTTKAVLKSPVILSALQLSIATGPSSESGIELIFLESTGSPTTRVSTATDELGDVLICVPSITQAQRPTKYAEPP
jgi:hypothetical protein